MHRLLILKTRSLEHFRILRINKRLMQINFMNGKRNYLEKYWLITILDSTLVNAQRHSELGKQTAILNREEMESFLEKSTIQEDKCFSLLSQLLNLYKIKVEWKIYLVFWNNLKYCHRNSKTWFNLIMKNHKSWIDKYQIS